MSKNWEVIRVYYGLLDTTKYLIRSNLTETQAKEMADRLSNGTTSSSTVYVAQKMEKSKK